MDAATSIPPVAPVSIRSMQPTDRAAWLMMRRLLWPDCPEADHAREMDGYLLGRFRGHRAAALVAVRLDERPGGFLEVAVRPFADGCVSQPVGYIEGWYVDRDLRRRGVGTMLIRAAEGWARGQGCTELASDCRTDNLPAYRAHVALGFGEVHQLIHFSKWLTDRH
jgi:aminoglycoside 6'-N-acetyltransferase I